MRKIINSETQRFEDVMTDNLVLDAKATVGSFNSITSDAVARAVAGASGEVPEVTENDNGKILTAVYDEGGPAVEWGDAPSGVPEYSAAEDGKVLGVVVDDSGDTPVASLDWVDQPADELPSVTGNAGKVLTVNSLATGVEWANAPTELPATLGTAGQVLTVNSGATGVEWATASGGGGTDATVITYNSASASQASTIFNTISTAVAAGKVVLLVDTINKAVATLSAYRNDEWGNYALFGSFTAFPGGSRTYRCTPSEITVSTLDGAVTKPSFTWTVSSGHLESDNAPNTDHGMVTITGYVGKDTLSGGEPANNSIVYVCLRTGTNYNSAYIKAVAPGVVANDGTYMSIRFSLTYNLTSITFGNKMYLSVQDASGNAVDIPGSRSLQVTVAS